MPTLNSMDPHEVFESRNSHVRVSCFPEPVLRGKAEMCSMPLGPDGPGGSFCCDLYHNEFGDQRSFTLLTLKGREGPAIGSAGIVGFHSG